VRVAGKTGTAQKVDPATGLYSQRSYLGWFVGIAPVEDPKLAIAVMIDEPQGIRVGGYVAAPVFARVAAAQLARHDILTEPVMPAPGTPASTRPALPAPQLRADARPPLAPDAPLALGQEPAREEAATGGHLRVEQLGRQLLVPDFSGRSTAEVRRATAGTGLQVEIDGEGTAIEQDPAPGTILDASRSVVRVRFGGPGLASQGL